MKRQLSSALFIAALAALGCEESSDFDIVDQGDAGADTGCAEAPHGVDAGAAADATAADTSGGTDAGATDVHADSGSRDSMRPDVRPDVRPDAGGMETAPDAGSAEVATDTGSVEAAPDTVPAKSKVLKCAKISDSEWEYTIYGTVADLVGITDIGGSAENPTFIEYGSNDETDANKGACGGSWKLPYQAGCTKPREVLYAGTTSRSFRAPSAMNNFSLFIESYEGGVVTGKWIKTASMTVEGDCTVSGTWFVHR